MRSCEISNHLSWVYLSFVLGVLCLSKRVVAQTYSKIASILLNSGYSLIFGNLLVVFIYCLGKPDVYLQTLFEMYILKL